MVLTPVALLAALVSTTLGAPGEPAGAAPAYEAEVRALSADVELLQQLNRLQLAPEQMDGLMALAARRQAVAESLAPKREELFNALASALRQKRQLLLRDEPVSEEMDDRIAKLNTELSALDYAEVDQARKLVTDLRGLLSQDQLAAITGRYEARESALGLLDWVRGLDANQYEDEADAAAEELEAPDAGLPAEEVRKILDQARGLDDAAFADQRAALAEKLLPAYALSEGAQTQMILDLLGNPRLISLLQDKKAAQGR